MRISVLGTGMVGQAIGSKLVSLGHEVRMGSRTARNEKAEAWAKAGGARASSGTFADAAAFGELVFNCTQGASSLEALKSAGEANLRGKVLVDVANPLDMSRGMPPPLFLANTDSLGELLQRSFPEARIVKSLNTVNAELMVDPGRLKEGHDIFVSGNDAAAKEQVTRILKNGFGWKSVIDLGDISTARATESYLLLWLRLWGALKTAEFNIRVVR